MQTKAHENTTHVVEKALSLEVGRRYVDRLGYVIEITEPWAGAIFKFTGRQVSPVFQSGPNEFRYQPDGRFMPEGRSDYDLIAEEAVDGMLENTASTQKGEAL